MGLQSGSTNIFAIRSTIDPWIQELKREKVLKNQFQIVNSVSSRFVCNILKLYKLRDQPLLRVRIDLKLEMSSLHDKCMTVLIFKMKYAFSSLECLSLIGFKLNFLTQARLFGALRSVATNLELLKIYHCVVKKSLVVELYLMMRQKKNQHHVKLNLQVISLKEFYVRTMDLHRVGYILSLCVPMCKQLFHTQVDSVTNVVLMKYFLTAGDLAMRQKIKIYVSLGNCGKDPRSLYAKYKGIWKYADLRMNPLSWSQNITTLTKLNFKDIDDSEIPHE